MRSLRRAKGLLLTAALAAAASSAAARAAPARGLELLGRAVADFEPREAQPCEGRGIVISAGGPVLLTNALMLLAALRDELGSKLPIEIYHAGAEELDAGDGRFLESSFPDVVVVDMLELPEPEGFPQQLSRARGSARGYQTKVYAALQSSFCEVLVLDADNTPMQDPAGLFEDPLYQEHGSLFWPDYNCTAAWVSAELTDVLGLPAPSLVETSTESGVFLLDKVRHQDALEYAWLLNVHNDIIYGRYAHGDKDLYRLGFQLAGKGASFAQVSQRPAAVYAREHGTGGGAAESFGHFAMVQHSPSSARMMFLHRTTLHSKLVTHALQSPSSDLVVTVPLSLEYVFHRLQFEQHPAFLEAPEVVEGRQRKAEILNIVSVLLRLEAQTVEPAIRAGKFLASFTHVLGRSASLARMAAEFYEHSRLDSGHYQEYFSHKMRRRLTRNGTNITGNETGLIWDNETVLENVTDNVTEPETTATTTPATQSTTPATTSVTTRVTTSPTTSLVPPSTSSAKRTFAVVRGHVTCWVERNVDTFVMDQHVIEVLKNSVASKANVPASYVHLVLSLKSQRRLQGLILSDRRLLASGYITVNYEIRIPTTDVQQVQAGSQVQAAIESLTPSSLSDLVMQEMGQSAFAQQLLTLYTSVAVSDISVPLLVFEDPSIITVTSTATVTTTSTTTLYRGSSGSKPGEATDTVVTGDFRCSVAASEAEAFVRDPAVQRSMQLAISIQAHVPLSYVGQVTLTLEGVMRRLQRLLLWSTRRLSGQAVGIIVQYEIRIPAWDQQLQDGSTVQQAISLSTTADFTHSVAEAMRTNNIDGTYGPVAVSNIQMPTVKIAGQLPTTTTILVKEPTPVSTSGPWTPPTDQKVPVSADSSGRGLTALSASHWLAAVVFLSARYAAH